MLIYLLEISQKKILQETINDFGLDADMSNIALNFEEKNQIRLRPLTE